MAEEAAEMQHPQEDSLAICCPALSWNFIECLRGLQLADTVEEFFISEKNSFIVLRKKQFVCLEWFACFPKA